MHIAFEPSDLDIIAEKVVEALRPVLAVIKENKAEDIIFDVQGLCDYIHVTPKWIHERTHLKQIPYYKLSNKQLRFRKKDIDKWLETLRTPALSTFSGRLKSLK